MRELLTCLWRMVVAGEGKRIPIWTVNSNMSLEHTSNSVESAHLYLCSVERARNMQING